MALVCYDVVRVRGVMASQLVRSTPVRAMVGVIKLFYVLTLTVPLYIRVYNGVPANSILGVTLRWTSIPSRESLRSAPSRFMLHKP